MTKFPSFKPRNIEKILVNNGFELKRQSGSHRVYFSQKTNKTAIVPFHTKDIASGTVRSIIKQSGLDESIFFKK